MRKKLGKIGKSVLSVIICLTMLLTTFCFFDIGLDDFNNVIVQVTDISNLFRVYLYYLLS